MATFIATVKFTAEGVQNVQGSPKWAAAFTAAAKKLGVKAAKVLEACPDNEWRLAGDRYRLREGRRGRH